MLINYFNYYAHPKMDITNIREGWCKGSYILPFECNQRDLNLYSFSSDYEGRKILRSVSVLDGKINQFEDAVLIQATSFHHALVEYVEFVDKVMFLRFVTLMEEATFVLPFKTLPVRFSDVDLESKRAKGYINMHKAVLAYKSLDTSPYKIRVSTPQGVVQIDAKHSYDAQKWLRNCHKL